MRLYCQTIGAILLWTATIPSGMIVPQGGETKIEVCRIGVDTLEVETQMYVYDTPAGKVKKEKVCFRDGVAKTDHDCWIPSVQPNPEQVVVP